MSGKPPVESSRWRAAASTPAVEHGAPGPHFATTAQQPETGFRVAVIIVNYNSGRMLRRCLEATAAQQVAAEEIIIVDNASDDGSLDAVSTMPMPVSLLRLPQNVGFAAACNRALAELEDVDWVALLNPDAFPEPGWLAALARAAGSHPECGSFACPTVRDADPTIADGLGDNYHVSGMAWREGSGRPLVSLGISAREMFAPSGAAACYRRRAVLECGGFDEDYFCYFEDVDLGFRLRLAGYACRLIPDALVRHVGSATTGRRSDFTVYHAQRNLEWTWWKNMPGWLLLWYLPQHLLLAGVTWGWYALQGRPLLVLRSKWAAYRGLAGILRKRRVVQRQRRISLGALRRQMTRGWWRPYTRCRT